MSDMMIPATPIPGTADSTPLVTQQDYEQLTGDCGTSDADFAYFLPDALDMLQHALHRTLAYGQYTERLFVYRDGLVYGSAVPYDVNKGLSNPAVPEDFAPGNFQGYAIWIGWYSPLPFLPSMWGTVPPQIDVTYWGGFVGRGSTVAGHLLPAGLKRIICKIIWFMANPAMLPGMPGGTKSQSVGGVSLSGDGLSSMVTSDAALACAIKKWRHPNVRAFAGQPTVPVPTPH